MRTQLINKAIGNILNAMKHAEGNAKVFLRGALGDLYKARKLERQGDGDNADMYLRNARFDLRHALY